MICSLILEGRVQAIMEQWQTILILKGAAGKIILFARQEEDGVWQYYRSNDSLQNQANPTIVHSFQDALSLLGHSWKYLSPEYIHPAFKSQLWKNLSVQTGMFNRSNWRKACL